MIQVHGVPLNDALHLKVINNINKLIPCTGVQYAKKQKSFFFSISPALGQLSLFWLQKGVDPRELSNLRVTTLDKCTSQRGALLREVPALEVSTLERCPPPPGRCDLGEVPVLER